MAEKNRQTILMIPDTKSMTVVFSDFLPPTVPSLPTYGMVVAFFLSFFLSDDQLMSGDDG